ncbi:MAG: M20 family metallopeptidase [Chitinophagales bacterium]|nr:M20 family metallopeptidase [Chitinophagales bacterium]
MDMLEQIRSIAKELLPEIISIRRHLHAHPELSFKEEATSAYIQNILSNFGIEFSKGWAGHGIVAHIQGKSDRLIALRADMDALPILEANEVSYKSNHDGIMHACGHDVHMAGLIGAILILERLKSHLPHSFRFIFQPGEEKLPGGASLMIQEGALNDPMPHCIIGQHVFPELPAGKVGIRSGLYMASADEIYITVTGKGGHGAMPHQCTDAILSASQLIVAMQQLVARHCPPAIPSVLSFGKINSVGGATNIIPNEVKIEGTFRTMDEDWRAQAHALIERIAMSTCAAYGTAATVRIEKGYPCLFNNETLTQGIHQNMVRYLGKENVVDLDIRMTSEDFAFYSHVVPACFYRLGTAKKGEINSGVHTDTFDIDESALEIAMGLMAWLAYSMD